MTSLDSHPPELPVSVSGKGNNRTLRGCMMALGIVGVLFSLSIICALIFISTEGKRAENEWNDYKIHWEAKGEVFDLDKIIPPAIPEEENFAATAIIEELYDEGNYSRLSNLNLREIPGLKLALTSSHAQTTPKWQRQALGAPSLDLAAYLQNPILHSNETAAATSILAALKPLEPIFRELSQASRLPKANFPIDYNKPFSAELKHLSPLLASIKTLALRARARIITGDSEGARDDILTMLRLGNLLGSEPSIISSLVEATTFKIVLTVIWEGLNSKQLESADLKQISGALQNRNLKPRLVRALRYERAAFLTFIDSLRLGKTRGNNDDRIIAIKSAAQSLNRLGLARSFFFKNMLNYSRFIQEHGLITGDEINRDWINLEATMDVKEDLKNS